MSSRCLVLDSRADVFGPIVIAKHLGLATPLDDLLELPDHQLRGQREVNRHVNGLTVEVIDHIEQPKRSAIFKLIMHKVYKPNLIDFQRHC